MGLFQDVVTAIIGKFLVSVGFCHIREMATMIIYITVMPRDFRQGYSPLF